MSAASSSSPERRSPAACKTLFSASSSRVSCEDDDEDMNHLHMQRMCRVQVASLISLFLSTNTKSSLSSSPSRRLRYQEKEKLSYAKLYPPVCMQLTCYRSSGSLMMRWHECQCMFSLASITVCLNRRERQMSAIDEKIF
jgi:hypothetical protein